MELIDLAFGQRHQFDASKGEKLEQGGNVFLIPGQPVEGLGYHDVEDPFAGIPEQLLVAGPERARPAAGGVGIGRRELPAFLRDPLPADPDLVLDRSLALEVSRITGIYHGAHRLSLPVWFGFS
jgi:hypothetical protein